MERTAVPQHLSAAANTGPALRPGKSLSQFHCEHESDVKLAANRLPGANPDDFTSHMPSQATWTTEDMPEIIYQWKPTPANVAVGLVRLKPYLIFGQKLRAFDVLPDRISSNVEPWLLQAWFRLDSRIQWRDMTDRIEPSARPNWNTLNMACVRMRDDFLMRPWSASRGADSLARDDAFGDFLRDSGIDPSRNSTRGLTPGLVDPTAGPNSERIPVPDRWVHPRRSRKADSRNRPANVHDNSQASGLSVQHVMGSGQASSSRNDSHEADIKRESPESEISGLKLEDIPEERVVQNSETANPETTEEVGNTRPRRRKAVSVEEAGPAEDETPRKKQRVRPVVVNELEGSCITDPIKLEDSEEETLEAPSVGPTAPSMAIDSTRMLTLLDRLILLICAPTISTSVSLPWLGLAIQADNRKSALRFLMRMQVRASKR